MTLRRNMQVDEGRRSVGGSHPQSDVRGLRTNRRMLGIAVSGLALVLLLSGIGIFTGRILTVGVEAAPAGPPLTAADVIGAFQEAGLAVDNPRQDPPNLGGPSGPPATELEAWSFSIPGLAPSGGRIMVFDGDEKMNKKAAWFRRSGMEGTVMAHRNVILWLDPALDPNEAARYRQALKGLR